MQKFQGLLIDNWYEAPPLPRWSCPMSRDITSHNLAIIYAVCDSHYDPLSVSCGKSRQWTQVCKLHRDQGRARNLALRVLWVLDRHQQQTRHRCDHIRAKLVMQLHVYSILECLWYKIYVVKSLFCFKTWPHFQHSQWARRVSLP